jgi:ATP-dependent helicase/nuclease subunit A
LTKSIAASPPPDWDAAEKYVNAQSEKAILANQIAVYIQSALAQKNLLPSRGRPVKAGDFLILVRHRDELVHELTRACKARHIPLAGLDRLVLTSQQAVSDLLALCDCLLLPSDDIAFAQFLVSPLGGLTDESLMELALNRRGALSFALFARRAERQDWRDANDFFQALRKQVDFISPYSLLSVALGPLGGRAKLLRRLGPEASEPIDEMLAEAQSYVRSHPASLQQFVFDLRQSGATIKREPEGAGDVVRIMTVHGAKGLQAPIVILPDTTSIPKTSDHLFWLDVPEQFRRIPVYCPHKDLRSQAIASAIADAKEQKLEEYNRLLYVALTRAEDELIICGAEGKNAAPPESWYNVIKHGFLKLLPDFLDDEKLYVSTPQTAKPDRVTGQEQSSSASLPGWVGTAPDWRSAPPQLETKRPEPLAPSRNTDDQEIRKTTPSPLFGMAPSRNRTTAMARGKIVHALLQHLPGIDAAERASAAKHYLGQPALALNVKMQTEIAASVHNLLNDPASRTLFGPGSRAEVPLAGVADDIEIGGLVDRLVVTDQSVIIVDFKTDRDPPLTDAEIPPAYLRQLAAYRSVIRQIYPNKTIICQLIWTENGLCMPVSDDLLAGHAPAPAQAFANQQAT